MKAILLTLFFLTFHLFASDTLVFGAIATVNPEIMKKKLTPLMKEIEKATNKHLIFKTGYDYTDTIKKFADGTFDIGYIGPAPYIKVKNINKNALILLAGIKNSQKSPFRSVIFSKKGSKYRTYNDLKNQDFAFGSPNSTLSYYVPKYMLQKENIAQEIKRFRFMGRHDKVAQYVIMGRYAAGAVKQSVANKYAKYIQVIATSKPLVGFAIVASTKLDPKTIKKLQHLFENFHNIKALKQIKKSAIGFEKRKDSQYDRLRKIMQEVDSKHK